MRFRNVLRFGAAALMTVAGMLAVPPSPAQADPIPPTQWSPANLPGARERLDLLTHADGGVTVGCSEQHASAFKSFGPSGSVTQSRQWADPRISACDYQMAVGADGTLFTTALTGYNSQTSLVQAYKANRLVWSFTVPCLGQVYDVELGTNGRVYVLVGQMHPPCASSSAIIGLTPTAQSGTTRPSQVLNAPVNGNVWYNGLAVYKDGFAIQTHAQLQYLALSGTPKTPFVVNTNYEYGSFAATPDTGRVIVSVRGGHDVELFCNSVENIAVAVAAYESTGRKWQHTSLPACSQTYELRPTPTGGAIVHYRAPRGGVPNSEWDEYLTALSATGGRLWTERLDGGPDTLAGTTYAVDLNGNIAVQQRVTVRKDLSGSAWRFPEVHFRLLSGTTGKAIGGTTVVLRGDTSTTNGPSYDLVNSSILPAIARNTAYIAAVQCSNLDYGCNPATTKLYAFKVPGLAMDYPRGAVLQWNTPWLNYAALGDSFSSGEGVPAFESGTNTAGPSENRCHRSTQAYAKLLNGNLSTRLRLTTHPSPTTNGPKTTFVACSGATTGNILNGQYSEPPQIITLTTSTQVVTISIGGNDIGFKDFASSCVFNGGVTGPCDRTAAYGIILSKLQYDLPNRLRSVLTAIKQKIGSQTRVLVVGYPMMIPDASTYTGTNCPYLEPSEKTAARDVIMRLNAALVDAVRWINGVQAYHNFQYVDPNYSGSPFQDHELCRSDSYFNGIELPIPYSMHPNEKGQDAYRQVVLRHLAITP